MANIKFSQFTQKTTLGTVDFLVGYTGADNVQIDPADLLSDYSQGTGAAGQVTFFSATSTVTGDNDFYWDNTNKRLGIGTTTPVTKLQVDSTSDFSVALSKRGSTSSALKFTLSNPNTTTNTWKIEHDASENLKIFGYSADNLLISTNSTERMRITSSGNVGIGTTTPAAKLEVDGTLIATGISQLGSGGSNVYLTSSSAGNVGIGTSSPSYKLDVAGEIKSDGYRIDLSATTQRAITSTGTDSIQFGDSGVNEFKFKNTAGTSMIINSSGNVGVGTTSPSNKLVVNGTVHLGSNGSDVTIGASNSSVIFMLRSGYNYIQASDASGALMFRTGGNNNRMIIDSSGNVGIGTTEPKARLHISGSDSALSAIRQSRVGTVIWDQAIDSSGRLQWGTRVSEAGSRTVRFTLDDNGKVGIGTGSPASKLEVDGGDIEVDDSGSGLILRSPDGTRYRVTVANGGTLSVSAV